MINVTLFKTVKKKDIKCQVYRTPDMKFAKFVAARLEAQYCSPEIILQYGYQGYHIIIEDKKETAPKYKFSRRKVGGRDRISVEERAAGQQFIAAISKEPVKLPKMASKEYSMVEPAEIVAPLIDEKSGLNPLPNDSPAFRRYVAAVMCGELS